MRKRYIFYVRKIDKVQKLNQLRYQPEFDRINIVNEIQQFDKFLFCFAKVS